MAAHIRGGATHPYSPLLSPYLGQQYELQPHTYNSSLPVYHARAASAAAAPWVYYNQDVGQWQIADAFMGQKVGTGGFCGLLYKFLFSP